MSMTKENRTQELFEKIDQHHYYNELDALAKAIGILEQRALSLVDDIADIVDYDAILAEYPKSTADFIQGYAEQLKEIIDDQ